MEAVPIWLLLVLIGPAMGSFSALLAERLLRGEAVVMARSACRSCGARLEARDLVPLLSHALLRGRCRHCGAAIPARLWQAEWAGLGLGALAVALAAGPAEAVWSALWLWCLLALALADLQRFRLPDPLTTALLALGLGLAWPDWQAAALGATIGAGAFLALRLGYGAATGREGMGLGDVKLMAGIGAGLGALALPLVALLAGLSGLSLAWWRAYRKGRRLRRETPLPFGALLAAAAAAVWLLGLY